MNFDELGHSWREQNAGSNKPDSTELLTKVVRRAERGRITNYLLGAVGCVASLLVLRDFSNLVMNDPNSFVRVGATLCVLGALGLLPAIVYALWPNQSSSQSVCDYFSRELQRTDKLIASNSSPFAFVLLALVTVGVCVIAVSDLPTPHAILTIALATGIGIAAWWGGRRSVSRAMTLRNDLQQLLSELREDPA